MVVFGSILKDLRLKAGMTQKELAEKLGVTKSVISYYELSERTPSPEILLELSNLFHVTTDYLLGREKLEHEYVDIAGLEEKDRALIRGLVQSLRSKLYVPEE